MPRTAAPAPQVARIAGSGSGEPVFVPLPPRAELSRVALYPPPVTQVGGAAVALVGGSGPRRAASGESDASSSESAVSDASSVRSASSEEGASDASDASSESGEPGDVPVGLQRRAAQEAHFRARAADAVRISDVDLTTMLAFARLRREAPEGVRLLTYRRALDRPQAWTAEVPTLTLPAHYRRACLEQGAGRVEQLSVELPASAMTPALAAACARGLGELFPQEPGQPGFYMAGGAVCDALRGAKAGEVHDLDMFAVGLTEAQAEARVRAFIERLHAAELQAQADGDQLAAEGYVRQLDDARAVQVYRTANCYTVLVPALQPDRYIELQFITRLYATLAQVLYGFDIWASAVAYDGHLVYLTEEATFAHQTGFFPVELELRRASYERRLAKYVARKGFGLILPQLDVDKAVNESGVAGLGFLSFGDCVRPAGPDSLGPAHITCGDIHTYYWRCNNDQSNLPQREPRELPADLDARVYGSLPYYSEAELVCYNLRRLNEGATFLVFRPDAAGAWEVFLGGEDLTSIVRKEFTAPLDAKRLRRLAHLVSRKRDWNRVCGAIARLDLIHFRYHDDTAAEVVKLNADLDRIAAQVAERARAAAAAAALQLGWRGAADGTALRPGANPGEVLFALEPTDVEAWYGTCFREEP